MKFFSLGTSKNFTDKDNIRIRLANSLAFALSLLGIPYFILFYWAGQSRLAWFLIAVVACYGSCFILSAVFLCREGISLFIWVSGTPRPVTRNLPVR